MKRYLLLLCVLLLGITLKSQSYTYHYWFDFDIGQIQNGIVDNGGVSLNVTSLPEGLHWLNIMLKDEIYSVPERYLFYKVKTEEAYVLYSYWFDEDIDNIQTNTLVGNIIMLDVNALDAGLHWLNVMLKRDEYSVAERYLFFKPEVEQPVNVSCRYWFDEDSENLHIAELGDGILTLDVNELTPGQHVLNIQLENHVLSVPQNYSFYKTPMIYVSVNPEESGIATMEIDENICTITATANEGYHFVNWTKSGEVVSTNAVYNFNVIEEGSYIANFELNSYEITVVVNPENTGTATGDGTFIHGTSDTLVATPAEHYHFVNWTKSDTVVSTDATYILTVTEVGTYVANFEIDSFEITATANPTEGGTVTGTGTYNYGATATLVATADMGYHFVNWTLNGASVSTDSNITITVTENAAYVANFEINSYEITVAVNPENTGTATGAGTFNHGATVTLVAIANTGYHFANWTLNGASVSTDSNITITVTENAVYIANFEINNYEITAIANPTAGGIVTGAGTYSHGATAILTETANTGYHFVNWTLNGAVVSIDSSITIIVTENAAYVANFELNSYEITAIASPTAGGTVTGAGTYIYGATAILIATANTGYHFVNWTENGATVSTNATYAFTVTEAKALVANFEIDSFEITAIASPTAGGTVTGAGTYNYGATVTLVATVNTGYHFVNWTLNGATVSTDSSITITVTENAAYIANFELNSYTITAAVDPENGGTINGADTYNYGETATLSVTLNENFTFVSWTENGNVVSTEATYSFEVTGDRNLVANLMDYQGIGEMAAGDFRVYPNPADDIIFIEIGMENTRCEIYTSSSCLVYKDSNFGNKMEINISDLPPGSYIIKFISEDNVYTRKFVKR